MTLGARTHGGATLPRGAASAPAKKNTACRYCDSRHLTQVLSLGPQPPSNSFIRPETVGAEAHYPLDVYFCEGCSLVQLLDVVPAELIFDNYLYLSSSSLALKRHYAALTESVGQRFGLKPGGVVVDIGCNDGTLLHGYTVPGVVRIGVEPSRVADVAARSGLHVMNAFFGTGIARQIVARHGPATIVTATNVFPHVDDIGRFTDGVLPLLGDRGVFMIEASYLVDLIDQTLFDTIYHEHLCYLSLTPVVAFLSRHGLEVFDVERVPVSASGPAFRIFVQRRGGHQPIRPSVEQMLREERAWGVGRLDRYTACADQIEHVKAALLQLLKQVRASGARIGGYGAPAKGNTLLNYFRITLDLVERIAETNRLKQGLLTPGSHIPIVSEEEFLEWMPDYALLLSWNYLEFFLEKSDYIRRGGKFIVPLPVPRIVP